MIIHFVILCVVIGLVLWLINTFIPLDPRIKQIMNIGAIILLVVDLIYELAGSGGGNFLGR